MGFLQTSGAPSVPEGRWRNARAKDPGDRCRGDRGASLVEFAIVLPVLVTLLLGMISSGVAYNQKLDLVSAAREGARYGATLPSTQTFTSGYATPNTWEYGIRQYVVDKSGGALTTAQVCVSLVEGATPSVVGGHTTDAGGQPCVGTDAYPSYNATTDRGRRVQVLVSRPGKIDLGVFPTMNFTMTSKAIAKSESSL